MKKIILSIIGIVLLVLAVGYVMDTREDLNTAMEQINEFNKFLDEDLIALDNGAVVAPAITVMNLANEVKVLNAQINKLVKGELPVLADGTPVMPLMTHFISDINQVLGVNLAEYHEGEGRHE